MTTQPKDLMTLEKTIKGLETLRLHECGSSNRAVAALYDAAIHHLKAGKRDTERLDWLLAYLTQHGSIDGLDWTQKGVTTIHNYDEPDLVFDREAVDEAIAQPQPKGEA